MIARRVTAPHHEALIEGLPAWLTLVGLLLVFTVSAPLLDQAGISYSTPAGAAWEKVHPGTDCLLAAFLIAAARRGNPLHFIQDEARRFPGVAAFAVVTTFLIAYLIQVQHVPFTPIIDTFIMPMLLLPLLADLPSWARRIAEIGLHAILCFNALLGIYEFLTGWHLIPTPADEMTLASGVDWRAYGIMGHPLSSAAMAGLYAVVLALGGGTTLPRWARPIVIVLQWISLAAFGGRTALVLTVVSFCLLGVMRLSGILAGRRFDRRQLGLSLLLSPLLAAGAFLLINGGFFDQTFDRFASDNGSAKSRETILGLFSQLSWHDLLFGPDPAYLASLLHLFGLEVGIESFWLGFVVICGLLMALVFFAGFAAFLLHVLQVSSRGAILPMLFFLVIISSSIGLSAKSMDLGRFVALVMILMPRATRSAAAWRVTEPFRVAPA